MHVENDIGPVVGLKLKVTRFKWQDFQKLSTEQQRYADPNSFEEIIAESITDSTGMAQFTLDRTGSFTLSPESQASQLDWVELKVLEQTTSATVEMKWPAVPILRVAHLRGKLISKSPGQAIAEVGALEKYGVSAGTLVVVTQPHV